MKKNILVITILTLVLGFWLISANAGPPLQKCRIQAGPPSLGIPQPTCAIELTCTDDFVKLGFQDGVCFRATCPGVWAILHRRSDEVSFRKRFLTYRHYTFIGYWKLKDQGTIETGLAPLRELFLVMPDDLIEFKMSAPDCKARIDVKNLGYIKKGNPRELQAWLAKQTYMANMQPACPLPPPTQRQAQQCKPMGWGSRIKSALNWLYCASSPMF